ELAERMRVAGRAAREVLLDVAAAVRPGVTTEELDRVCFDAWVARGGYPSPLHYKGYPKSLCTSVNEVICHGIPDDRPLAEGDIVNLDVTIYLAGMHGDTHLSVRLELDVTPAHRAAPFRDGVGYAASRPLVRVNHESLWKGI